MSDWISGGTVGSGLGAGAPVIAEGAATPIPASTSFGGWRKASSSKGPVLISSAATPHRMGSTRSEMSPMLGMKLLRSPGGHAVDRVEGVRVEQALREQYREAGPERGERRRHREDADDDGEQDEAHLVRERVAEHGPQLGRQRTGAHPRLLLLGLLRRRGQAEGVAGRADHGAALALDAVRAPALAALRADPLRRRGRMVRAAAPGAAARAGRTGARGLRRAGGRRGGSGRWGRRGGRRLRDRGCRRRRRTDGWCYGRRRCRGGRRGQGQRRLGHHEDGAAAAAAGLQAREPFLVGRHPQGLAALRTEDRHVGPGL